MFSTPPRKEKDLDQERYQEYVKQMNSKLMKSMTKMQESFFFQDQNIKNEVQKQINQNLFNQENQQQKENQEKKQQNIQIKSEINVKYQPNECVIEFDPEDPFSDNQCIRKNCPNCVNKHQKQCEYYQINSPRESQKMIRKNQTYQEEIQEQNFTKNAQNEFENDGCFEDQKPKLQKYRQIKQQLKQKKQVLRDHLEQLRESISLLNNNLNQQTEHQNSEEVTKERQKKIQMQQQTERLNQLSNKLLGTLESQLGKYKQQKQYINNNKQQQSDISNNFFQQNFGENFIQNKNQNLQQMDNVQNNLETKYRDEIFQFQIKSPQLTRKQGSSDQRAEYNQLDQFDKIQNYFEKKSSQKNGDEQSELRKNQNQNQNFYSPGQVQQTEFSQDEQGLHPFEFQEDNPKNKKANNSNNQVVYNKQQLQKQQQDQNEKIQDYNNKHCKDDKSNNNNSFGEKTFFNLPQPNLEFHESIQSQSNSQSDKFSQGFVECEIQLNQNENFQAKMIDNNDKSVQNQQNSISNCFLKQGKNQEIFDQEQQQQQEKDIIQINKQENQIQQIQDEINPWGQDAQGGCKILINNLNPEMEENMIKDFMSCFGEIVSFDLQKRKLQSYQNNINNNYDNNNQENKYDDNNNIQNQDAFQAVVHFQDSLAAQEAIYNLDQQIFEGRVISVQVLI
ncbi:hypothetical protein PPERSA_02958 [Pseudocohnilembus persalinus]|uniref:RRM domain-containing protein n=1 Tax=Pseudocohnilembus persalinus TaxID=266149 RepID=A0A0V0QA63_PSEPJ|nr:hypothetical protein PPERSA_02958 [Pseudocohnilembus persalinus]|eukprot:KRW99126.1 hypothetical protein PPERSA_02958 [Pseudocohnilembus persalinus]